MKRVPLNVLSVKSVSDNHQIWKGTCWYITIKGPSNVLVVKNVWNASLTCKTISGYTEEKDPSSVLSVTNVSLGSRHCFITKENFIPIHRTNVNLVVNVSVMTMLWRGMIARNDLLETRKDSLVGCVMNTATIIVDIFITCISTCKDKWSYKRGPYIEPNHNKQQYFTNAWSALVNDLWAAVQTRGVYELQFSFSSSMQFCTHL